MNSVKDKQQEYKDLTENKSYSQNWPEYNKAQTKEKLLQLILADFVLEDLTDGQILGITLD